MDIIRINSVSDFNAHRTAIEKLFIECFGERLTADVWEWAYLRNPNGSGIASLCYDGSALVGHYAAIPVRLRDEKQVFNVYLSMTTMVAQAYRKEGLFVKLAANTNEFARDLGIDCIVGFPNAMSTPGFRNKLGWCLPDPDFVATLRKEELLQHTSAFSSQSGKIGVDLRDEPNRAWRLSKPGTQAVWDDGLAYKIHQGKIDILAYEHPGQFNRLPEATDINLLVPASLSELSHRQNFAYQFGGISICKEFDPSLFQRQMGMSDVF